MRLIQRSCGRCRQSRHNALAGLQSTKEGCRSGSSRFVDDTVVAQSGVAESSENIGLFGKETGVAESGESMHFFLEKKNVFSFSKIHISRCLEEGLRLCRVFFFYQMRSSCERCFTCVSVRMRKPTGVAFLRFYSGTT